MPPLRADRRAALQGIRPRLVRAGVVAALIGAALAQPVRSVEAQVELIDQGSFALSREGRMVGREDFTIRRQAGVGGQVFRAQATITSSDLRLAPNLTTSAAGAPLSYQLDVHQDGDLRERLAGQVSRGRLTVRATGTNGDAAREYLAGDDAAVVDADVIHQHWFIVRQPAGRATHVIVPRTGGRATVRVREVGPDAIRVGDATVQATHLVLDGFPDGPREAWVDAERRLLRLSIPSLSLLATRQDPPN